MKLRVPSRKVFLLALAAACSAWRAGVVVGVEPKEATEATKQANAAVQEQLPFADRQDFEDARRGLIDEGPATIRDARGRVVWDVDQYAFLKGDGVASDTVNPSLWRQAQLNLIRGLFKVTDRVYQVRG